MTLPSYAFNNIPRRLQLAFPPSLLIQASTGMTHTPPSNPGLPQACLETNDIVASVSKSNVIDQSHFVEAVGIRI